MGDLADDTAVRHLGGGHYRGRLERAWEIWGPEGGYVASLALRAAGAESPFDRPATFACHYLAVAEFAPVELSVTTLRRARTACSQRVTMNQGDRTILEALVWSVGSVEGLEHHQVEPPDVPGPDGVASIEELAGERPPFAFWDNFDQRPLNYLVDWPPAEPLDPVWRSWLRFRPTATFEDPWVDAARALVLLDVVSWPAGHRQHAWRQPDFTAPSLDLAVAFHEPDPGAEWLLADGHAPTAGQGLLGWQGRLWSPARRLIASGSGQALFRRITRR
ncbi:MAG: acyl-CoA thioesterase [Acidimicrobiales bacterium]